MLKYLVKEVFSHQCSASAGVEETFSCVLDFQLNSWMLHVSRTALLINYQHLHLLHDRNAFIDTDIKGGRIKPPMKWILLHKVSV